MADIILCTLIISFDPHNSFMGYTDEDDVIQGSRITLILVADGKFWTQREWSLLKTITMILMKEDKFTTMHIALSLSDIKVNSLRVCSQHSVNNYFLGHIYSAPFIPWNKEIWFI